MRTGGSPTLVDMLSDEEMYAVATLISGMATVQKCGVLMALVVGFTDEEIEQMRAVGRGDTDESDPKKMMVFRSVAGLSAVGKTIPTFTGDE